MKSSFNGIIDEIPGISVDNFEQPHDIQARAYFLSHSHCDHTQGLYSTELIEELDQSGAYIYTSVTTAAIVESESCDDRLLKFIRPLKLGTETIFLPALPSRNLKELYVDVSFLPAGHSLGSGMFLFKTKTKSVLFTGDFRLPINTVSKSAHFHDKKGDPIKLDAMYVDTTFFDSKYEDFPTREESIDHLMEELQKWLSNEHNMVALHTSAKHGYEFVFNEIFRQLGEKVFVADDRWQLYKNLSNQVTGVTTEDSRVHVCRNVNEYKTHEKCVRNYAEKKFLFVHFSAMKWTKYEIDSHSICKVNDSRIDVCFPTHCSRQEIVNFVEYFNPKKVVGFPNDYVSPNLKRKLPDCEDNLVVKCEERKNRKVDSNLLKKIFQC